MKPTPSRVLARLALAAGAALAAFAPLHAARAQGPNRAEVIHWWTSGGEAAAVKELANAYKAAGGTWVDTAIAGGEPARATAINRMVGGTPPTAAQFNTSQQFRDLIEGGMLNDVDDVARKNDWDHILPAPILGAIKIKGHFYAVPVDIHMPAWFWYSKAAFAKAGIRDEPKTPADFLAALDKLKAAGIVPLALGGQPWQEKITFDAWLAHVGGPELYLRLYRDRDPKVVQSPAFKTFLASFKRLKDYVDPGSPGRNWNDATAMVITGKAGVQIMGDWAKGEFQAAHQTAGKEFGCFPGFGPRSPYIVAGDVFVFPKTTDPAQLKSQALLAAVFTAPATQVAFNNKKGAIPIRTDVDASTMDPCAQLGLQIMKDPTRQLPNPEMLIPPDLVGALQDIVTKFWNTSESVDDAANAIATALKS
jgi:glucose/mannose transport system substrate-binding protein